ncbi:hypothetical protein [Synechococcus sp. A15-28]|uniref:hypothetical protein n=1 Tax=Synechococcus sp. A15-28 TaxID=1050638 RepID=UPI0016483B95|nr:hypothetical protein [Synechococcus sp. A15-28]QNI41637.1 putative DnaJ type IV chaperone protein [Synechococcus sp. A15-28]
MSTCTICGGSGIQRVSGQHYRTCLTCLGQGQLSAAIQAAPMNQLSTSDLTVAQLNGLIRQQS